MMSSCIYKGCSHHKKSDLYYDIIFHRFPDAEKQTDKFQAWNDAIPGPKLNISDHSRLCSDHFKKSDYNVPILDVRAGGRYTLKRNAVPSNFDPNTTGFRVPISGRRYLKLMNFNRSKNENIADEKASSVTSVTTQTTLTGPDLKAKFRSYNTEASTLRRKMRTLKTSISNLKSDIKAAKHVKSSYEEGAISFLKERGDDRLAAILFKNEVENYKHPASSRKYSDHVKEFCINLYSLSPRAYELVRKNSLLPHPTTVRVWRGVDKDKTTGNWWEDDPAIVPVCIPIDEAEEIVSNGEETDEMELVLEQPPTTDRTHRLNAVNEDLIQDEQTAIMECYNGDVEIEDTTETINSQIDPLLTEQSSATEGTDVDDPDTTMEE